MSTLEEMKKQLEKTNKCYKTMSSHDCDGSYCQIPKFLLIENAIWVLEQRIKEVEK